MRHPGFELVKEVPLRMQGNDMDISGEVVHDSAFTDSATPASNPNIFKIDVAFRKDVWSASPYVSSYEVVPSIS
jgi:hypothetical protein